MKTSVVAFVVVGVWGLSLVWAYKHGQWDARQHARVVILDAKEAGYGPIFGTCLDVYPGHPVCSVDDRKPIVGLFYPPAASP